MKSHKSRISPDQFESKVRDISELIWHCTATREKIAGMNCDCVLKPEIDRWVIVEATIEKNIHKTRDDVTNLKSTKSFLFSQEIYCTCFIVTLDEPTPSMKDKGKSSNITVLSFREYESKFFNILRYFNGRKEKPFGSSVDPITGEPDNRKYTPVNYCLIDNPKKDFTLNDIKKRLINGEKIVLIGDFGTGKSRCIQELFSEMSVCEEIKSVFPLCINLRDHWGAKYANTIISSHFQDLGLSDMFDSAKRLYNKNKIVLLLDGFDEIASQNWSTDKNELIQLRRQSLLGIHDLLKDYKSGVLITGREHFFNTNEEMLEALGLPDKTIILKCKEEFSYDEMRHYLHSLSFHLDFPEWLPRRPLICQVIHSLQEEILEKSFIDDDGEFEFWKILIKAICTREARIKTSLDGDSIRRILSELARISRIKANNEGPITINDINCAFERIVGTSPSGESALILNRLPGLGRVDATSDDRQFIDLYLLDGLRAENLIEYFNNQVDEMSHEAWRHALKSFGIRRVAYEAKQISSYQSEIIKKIRINAKCPNKVYVSDLLSILTQVVKSELTIGVAVENLVFDEMMIEDPAVIGIEYSNCMIEKLIIKKFDISNIVFNECIISEVVGFTSQQSLPSWLANNEVIKFEQLNNCVKIKRSLLSKPHKLLAAMLNKIYIQKGNGRQESSLKRGLEELKDAKLFDKIVNLLISEKVIKKHKGDSEFIYSPCSSQRRRIIEMLEEKDQSKDVIWETVGNL